LTVMSSDSHLIRVKTLVKTVATLLVLLAALPFNLVLTIIALLWAGLLQPFQPKVEIANPKTILISGGKMTKALQLARSLRRAGHRVILVESHKYWLTGHRFSWDVDRFYAVPKPDASDYIDTLLNIVQQEAVNVYIPVCSPVASYYDALAKKALSAVCEVLHLEVEQVQKLDHKYEFSMIATSLNLAVPESYCITDPQQVIDFNFSEHSQTYILKSIPYDSVRRLNLTRLPCASVADTQAFVEMLPISADTPWIMQAYLSGQEYCTHSTVRNGELRMHCCCRSSAFQVNYENVDHPEIETWVRTFVGHLKLTGQVSFDFIETSDGRIYAIECNPRTHSAITMFYNHPDVAKAYLQPEPLEATIQPLASSRPTYWIYHEIWRLLIHLGSPTRTWQRLQIIARGKDAIFDWADPLPFLLVHHLQIPWLLINNLWQLKPWIRIDFNIGKLVELAGD
jgi:predicted ATP-grasp superfamily ATP-dependent carboligase